MVKRPYILVGAVAYLIVTALAITSFKALMRKMGRRWQTLHNGVYLVAILAPIHFYWSVKSEIIEPSLYIVGFSVLLLWRTPWFKRHFSRKVANKTERKLTQDKASIKSV